MVKKEIDRQLHDQVFSLRDENIHLKKKLLESDDNAKKLMVQLQKLNTPSRGTKDKETTDLVKDLQNHVQQLNHSNSALKTKLQFFKTLYETESKKKTAYMHIPPRVETGLRRKPSHHSHHSLPTLVQNNQDVQSQQETMTELQELVTKYRLKIGLLDETVQKLEQENGTLTENNEQLQKNWDIDKVSLQHQVHELKKKVVEQRAKFDTVDEQYKSLHKSYKEMLVTTEALGKDLHHERERNCELENLLQKERLEKQKTVDLQVIIEDLQNEKALLQSELDLLMENRFSTARDEEFQQEILVLQQKNQSLEDELLKWKLEKQDLQKTILDLNHKLSNALNEKQILESKYLDLLHLKEQLELKIVELSNPNGPSKEDIEEALMLLRLKREAGVSFEYLSGLKLIQEENKSVKKLRQQYIECIQDLEKTKSMLQIQQSINKKNLEKLHKVEENSRKLQHEYELRIEEYVRLTDIRKHKIEKLQQQLRNIGVSEGISDLLVVDAVPDNPMEWKGGENRLYINIIGAVFADSVSRLLSLSQGVEHLCTFCFVDFYEFETEATPLGIGKKPLFHHTIKYNLSFDDFLLFYLQTGNVKIHICQSNGIDFSPFGYCAIDLSNLMKGGQEPFKILSDIFSNDTNEILGTMEYTIQVEIPIPLSVKAYQERTVALNLAFNDIPFESLEKSRGEINNLFVTITKAKMLKQLSPTITPNIYAVVQYEPAGHGIITPSVQDSYQPIFDYTMIIPNIVTESLDRTLRTSKMVICFMDKDQDFVYGYAKIPLQSLALGREINGEFQLEDNKGIPLGAVWVQLYWEHPYKLDAVVSLMDDPVLKEELTQEPMEHPSVLPSTGKDESMCMPTEEVLEGVHENNQNLVAEPTKVEEPKLTDAEAAPVNAESKPRESVLRKSTTNAEVPVSHQDPEVVQLRQSTVNAEINPRVSISRNSANEIPLTRQESEVGGQLRQSILRRSATNLDTPPRNLISEVGIQLHLLEIAWTDPTIQQLLVDTKQIFIGVEFLGISPELLESQSILLTQSSEINIGFQQSIVKINPGFSFEEIKNTSKLDKNILGSLDKLKIRFCVVDEPTEGMQRECIDLAIGELTCNQPESVGKEQKVDLYYLQTQVLFGTLSFSITGLPDFVTFMATSN